MNKLALVFTSQLPSGKNAIQISCRNGKPHKYPGVRFVAWRNEVEQAIAFQKSRWPVDVKMMLPIREQVKMTVDYVPTDNRTRDVSGMLDAIFHVLEHCEIIENDGLIRDVNWMHKVRKLKQRKEDMICAVVTLETY